MSCSAGTSSAFAGTKGSRPDNRLRLGGVGDEATIVVAQFGLDDDHRPADAEGTACRGDTPLAYASQKVRGRRDGRGAGAGWQVEECAHATGGLGAASDISAPPLRAPPAVHSSARHASRATTSSGVAETTSIPSVATNGTAASNSESGACVSVVQLVPFGPPGSLYIPPRSLHCTPGPPRRPAPRCSCPCGRQGGLPRNPPPPPTAWTAPTGRTRTPVRDPRPASSARRTGPVRVPRRADWRKRTRRSGTLYDGRAVPGR